MEQRRFFEHTIALYENSRSWYITRPLRSATNLVRLIQRAWVVNLLDRRMQLRVLG
jgi:hypothetical protein